MSRETMLETALRDVVQHARVALPGTPYRAALDRARQALNEAGRPPTPQALLRAAADLIEQAQSHLCTTGTPCRCCGALRYDEFTEYQASRNTRGLPGKLRREAEYLDGAPRPAHGE